MSEMTGKYASAQGELETQMTVNAEAQKIQDQLKSGIGGLVKNRQEVDEKKKSIKKAIAEKLKGKMEVAQKKSEIMSKMAKSFKQKTEKVPEEDDEEDNVVEVDSATKIFAMNEDPPQNENLTLETIAVDGKQNPEITLKRVKAKRLQ